MKDKSRSAAEQYRTFEEGLRRILTVSKSDLKRAEKEYQDSRPAELRRGPKPKTSGP